MDRHMQLLRLEVLAVNARVIAMPVETRRARARADDTRTTTPEMKAPETRVSGTELVDYRRDTTRAGRRKYNIRELLDELAD